MMRRTSAVIVCLAFTAFCDPAAATMDLDTPLVCEKRIANAICLAAPVRNVFRSRTLQARSCAGKSKNYTPHFVDIYRSLPPALQRELCALDRIFVEKKFWASGYAHPKLNAIGIHQRFVERQVTLSEWATWKERLAFATDQINARLVQGEPIGLPVVKAGSAAGPVLASYYVVAHELAHRMDLKNGYTRDGSGDFARLGWRGRGRKVRARTLPKTWLAPCFYWCSKTRKPIDLANAMNTYRGLLDSSFVSLYATINPAEDFAETVVYYVMSQRRDLSYEVGIGDDKVLDLSSVGRNPTLMRKLEFVKRLLATP